MANLSSTRLNAYNLALTLVRANLSDEHALLSDIDHLDDGGLRAKRGSLFTQRRAQTGATILAG